MPMTPAISATTVTSMSARTNAASCRGSVSAPMMLSSFDAEMLRVLGRGLLAAPPQHDHRAAVDVRVRRLEDDFALVAPGVEELDDAVVRALVDAGHRLVEQDHVGLLRDGAGDERAPLLAAGELADLLVGKLA